MEQQIDMARRQQPGQEDNFQIKDLLVMCLAKWYWFVIAVAICLGAACIKILRTPNVYNTSASVLIKETRSGRSTSSLENMLSSGMNSMGSKLANEMATFKSPALMSEVVKRLNLEVSCSTEGKFHDIALYGTTSPCTVTFLDETPSSVSFKLTPTASGYTISDLEYVSAGEPVKAKGNITGAFADTLSTAAGRIIIAPSAAFTGGPWTKPVKVRRTSNYGAMASCSKKLVVAADDIKNNSDVLNLSYKDVIPQRAEDIINTLISVYNEWWVEDNNKMAVSTSDFIDERLVGLERELGSVDEDISNYKSKNLLPDLKTASSIYMTESNEIGRQIQDLENQIYVARYVRNYLADSHKENEVIPMSSGLTDASLSNQITQYNTILLQRNTLLANSSDSNPLVTDLDKSLENMRGGIITSIDNLIQTMQAKEKALEQYEQKANRNIAANPNQEKYLLSVERQQKVKEALYLFLLQKREENELSQAFTAYNTKVITPPMTNRIPTEPQKSKILMLALILGLCIPLGIIYLANVLNTRLRGRKDLENLTVPFLGEIPLHGKPSRKNNPESSATAPVVKAGCRDITNEAFRVLRTNLEFMESEDRCKVIIDTSFNPGSGKTFMTVNLSASLAIKGKRVLAIDGDLRKASLSEYVNKPARGLSDYLAGKAEDIESLIIKTPETGNLSILPVGTIPPNPSELLGEKKLTELIEGLKSKYDYIFIDCPPLDIVADTQIISKLADRTIFIVRSGLLERAMIPDLQKIYDEGRLSNMVLVLNGTELGTARYGYQYGYKYGSSYGRYGSYSSYGN